MTSTSTEHRATVDHLRLIKASWAEIVPQFPPTITGHQMDRYWYRTYIAATRPRTPTVEHLTAEILGSPLPPETPERCTHRNQEEGNPC